MDLFNTEYNILKTAGNSLGFKHSLEAKQKISEARSGTNHPLFGKSHSEETKEKMSRAKGTTIYWC